MKRKILDKRNIVLSSVGIAMLSGAGVFAYNVNQPDKPLVSVAEEKEPEVASVEKVEKVKLEEPKLEITEKTTAPVAQIVQEPDPVPQVEEPAPVTYKWAAEMEAAGISESDYGIVSQLVLDDNGWVRAGRNAWYKGGECWMLYHNMVSCLKYADAEIKNTAGTWQNASKRWLTIGQIADANS